MAEIIDISEIKQGNGWSPIRRELDVQAFGINAWSGDDGAKLVGEHDEKSTGHEELYVVIAGTARFTVDGEDREIEGAKQMVTAALERYDDRSALLYNLACAEARLGEIEPAFGHLAEALAERPSLRDLARDDADFDALRGDARLDELVGTPVPG